MNDQLIEQAETAKKRLLKVFGDDNGKPLYTSEVIKKALILSTPEDLIWAVELYIEIDNTVGGGRYVDFWTMSPWDIKDRSFITKAYEIKVSRSDFLADIKDERKQLPALKYSDYFYFVTPPDLIKKSELPKYAGLYEWNGYTFKRIKLAPKQEKRPPDWRFVKNLIRFSGHAVRDSKLENKQLRYRIRYLEQKLKRLEEAKQVRFDWESIRQGEEEYAKHRHNVVVLAKRDVKEREKDNSNQ